MHRPRYADIPVKVTRLDHHQRGHDLGDAADRPLGVELAAPQQLVGACVRQRCALGLDVLRRGRDLDGRTGRLRGCGTGQARGRRGAARSRGPRAGRVSAGRQARTKDRARDRERYQAAGEDFARSGSQRLPLHGMTIYAVGRVTGQLLRLAVVRTGHLLGRVHDPPIGGADGGRARRLVWWRDQCGSGAWVTAHTSSGRRDGCLHARPCRRRMTFRPARRGPG